MIHTKTILLSLLLAASALAKVVEYDLTIA